MNRSLKGALFLIGLFAGGCGSTANPAAPTDSASPTPTPNAAAGLSTLTFTSTVTGSPVAGARVVVAGNAYTTGTDGTIALSTPAATGATIDTSAPGFLDRTTTIKADSTITLWEIPAGADTTFVRQLAYNRTGTPEVLWRPATTLIFLQFVGDLANDPTVRSAHIQAAAMASAMTGGRVSIQVGSAGTGAVIFNVLLNSAGPGSATATTLSQNRGNITGGKVEYASLNAAKSVAVIAHELGHVLGFGHAPSGIMCPSACGVDTFSPLENSVFISMWQRAPGTAALDNDRISTTSSVAAETVIRCDLR